MLAAEHVLYVVVRDGLREAAGGSRCHAIISLTNVYTASTGYQLLLGPGGSVMKKMIRWNSRWNSKIDQQHRCRRWTHLASKCDLAVPLSALPCDFTALSLRLLSGHAQRCSEGLK